MSSELKQQAARAALSYISRDCQLGIGTGSTVNCLIDLLATTDEETAAARANIDAVVASSEQTARRLETAGFRCSTLESVGELTLYIDGADEIDDNRQMIKGGGGAHTREKILACSARRFVAIVDEGKHVRRLGRFPLAVEVVPLARGYVGRKLVGMGGNVRWREGFVSDNGNWILDVTDLDLTAAADMERQINQLVGVVENGLFAARRADVAVIAGKDGIRTLTP